MGYVSRQIRTVMYDALARRLATSAIEGDEIADSAVGNRMLFTGREWDADVRMYHFRHRTYSPEDKRFMQGDPIGLGGGWNYYAYCGGNPVNATDPWGLTALPDYCMPENNRVRVWIIYGEAKIQDHERAIVEEKEEKCGNPARILSVTNAAALRTTLIALGNRSAQYDAIYILSRHATGGQISPMDDPNDKSQHFGIADLPSIVSTSTSINRNTKIVMLGCAFAKNDPDTPKMDDFPAIHGKNWSRMLNGARIVGAEGNTYYRDPFEATSDKYCWLSHSEAPPPRRPGMRGALPH